jgi:hypothetical protein
MAKRAREQAVKEKRDRKRDKKAEAAAQRAAGGDVGNGEIAATDAPDADASVTTEDRVVAEDADATEVATHDDEPRQAEDNQTGVPKASAGGNDRPAAE